MNRVGLHLHLHSGYRVSCAREGLHNPGTSLLARA